MIKKVFFTGVLALSIATIGFSQCSPDASFTQPGVYPDSTTNLPPAILNELYSEVITIVVPADTIITTPLGTANVPIDSLVLDNLTGLPAGFTYSCNPSSCQFPGGTSGCVLITGTASNAADVGAVYDLVANLTMYTQGQGFPSDPIEYYNIEITQSAGLSITKNKGLNVYPNPVAKGESITIDNNANAELTVVNALGEIVSKQTYNSTITIDTADLETGVYFFTLASKGETTTSKFVVTAK